MMKVVIQKRSSKVEEVWAASEEEWEVWIPMIYSRCSWEAAWAEWAAWEEDPVAAVVAEEARTHSLE